MKNIISRLFGKEHESNERHNIPIDYLPKGFPQEDKYVVQAILLGRDPLDWQSYYFLIGEREKDQNLAQKKAAAKGFDYSIENQN